MASPPITKKVELERPISRSSSIFYSDDDSSPTLSRSSSLDRLDSFLRQHSQDMEDFPPLPLNTHSQHTCVTVTPLDWRGRKRPVSYASSQAVGAVASVQSTGETLDKGQSGLNQQDSSKSNPEGIHISLRWTTSNIGEDIPGNRCYNCTLKGHWTRDCSNKPYCPHHKALNHTQSCCRARKKAKSFTRWAVAHGKASGLHENAMKTFIHGIPPRILHPNKPSTSPLLRRQCEDSSSAGGTYGTHAPRGDSRVHILPHPVSHLSTGRNSDLRHAVSTCTRERTGTPALMDGFTAVSQGQAMQNTDAAKLKLMNNKLLSIMHRVRHPQVQK